MTNGRIRVHNKTIWYDIWNGIDTDRLRAGDVLEYFLEDLAIADITVDQLKQYCLIVYTNWEGHSAEDIEPFRTMLWNINFPMSQFGALFTCFEDTDKLPYPAACATEKLIYNDRWHFFLKKQNVQWNDLVMDAKFVVLMRRASESRCLLAKKLLDKFESTDMKITLGTYPGVVSQHIKDIIRPYTYPLTVDKASIDAEQHNPQHELFYTVPVQLVVESSSQTDENVWRNIFITEKSYKAFAWHQFPIWYAVPNLVSKLRDAGFDLFDDIIDHSYDDEQDPLTRMDSVVAELQKLCEKDIFALRNSMFRRLESNAQLVAKIINTAHTEHRSKANCIENELLELYKSTTSIPTQ